MSEPTGEQLVRAYELLLQRGHDIDIEDLEEYSREKLCTVIDAMLGDDTGMFTGSGIKDPSLITQRILVSAPDVMHGRV
ncbi:MAG: hypothetical protein F4100_03715 [Rhodothermaceae bacterium]|nr:hypothetical protein [Rhodothermaceae bacterium]MYE63389.1 hypothetical protein [Rhodothermaceae bacterium]MYJ19844.1 hypothetical protein [Rhodothermaceae bacterium]